MNTKSIEAITPKVFVLDVDGVMTDGRFYYTAEGKVMKVFGPDDHDALNLLKPYLEILFVTGDKRGFPISKARIVDDMKMRLELVSTTQRIEWIKSHWDPAEVIYMGDGIFDCYVFREVAYSIAPSNADERAKEIASFVTRRAGSDRAVAEAALHVMDRFFEAYTPAVRAAKDLVTGGQWSV